MEEKGAFLEEELCGISGVLEVRRVGLILGFDIASCGQKFCRKLREFGVLTRPILNTIVLMPPLVVRREELEFLVRGVRSAFEQD